MVGIDKHTGVCGDGISDDILNILDFPMESLEGESWHGEDWDANFQCLGPIPLDLLHNPSVLSHPTSQLKQEPVFVEEISSPNSNPESSNSCSAEARVSIVPPLVIPAQPRSKRSRPSTLNPWLLLSPISFPPSRKISNPKKRKEKKKKKLSQVSGVMEITEKSFQQQPIFTSKKCTHCEITKTPQWREGPLGPKTLCNACGVRYRSGRLFPEYRPAASPTFVPSLHSNSHKKVVEMRNTFTQKTAI